MRWYGCSKGSDIVQTLLEFLLPSARASRIEPMTASILSSAITLNRA